MSREDELHDWVKEARHRLWDAEFIRKNDERRKGESEHHWHQRRKRNKERVEHRDDVVKSLTKKLEHLRKEKEEHHDEAQSGNWKDLKGYSTFDGKQVPAWMVHWLSASRNAGWHGVVVSGVRTSAQSVSLCIAMCGNTSCPGRCAGAASNHNMEPSQGYPAGALDVSDYNNFESIQYKIGSPLRNDLPIDPVHFSVSGH